MKQSSSRLQANTPHALDADPAQPHWLTTEPLALCEAVRGGVPAQKTRVQTLWTPTEWRVLFQCEDLDPWATLTQRDTPLFSEETVEVFLDPVGDLESYYELELNPLGTELDIIFRRSRSGYKGDWAWDCVGLRTFVRLVPGGWNAELAIPFTSVSEPPTEGTQWRVNFCRIDRPSRDGSLPRELTAWSPPMRETFHTPERFGEMTFISQ